MIEMIGLFLAVVLLLLIGYIGEVVSSIGDKEIEEDSCAEPETETETE